MDQVRMEKAVLIEKIKDNMQTHQATYEEAVKVFTERQRELLADMLEKAQHNRQFDRLALSRLPVPENHFTDYQVALEMLEYEVEDQVILTDHDFRRYVRDEWEWQHSFAANTESYVAR